MSQKHAIIIGGGLGGLATALRLSAQGWSVTVCEAGPTVGGKLNQWSHNGFVFDTGPSLITMPWVFEELFEDAGSSLKEHVQLISLNPLADYIFPDGTSFTYSTDLQTLSEAIRLLDQHDVAGLHRFIELGKRIFNLSEATFFSRPPLDPPSIKTLKALKQFPILYAWGNYHKTVATFFKNRYLQQLYDRYPTYVGSSPYLSPATLNVIPYIELTYGGWYVRGGLYCIVEALVKLLEKAGATIITNSEVKRIKHNKKCVGGVHLISGEDIDSDIVIMNGEASYAPILLGEAGAEPLDETRRSMSGLVFLLGIRRQLPDLKHHTIYFSGDYEYEFKQLFEDRRFPEDPTVYVNITSRTDRSVTPEEGEALFIMANAPANDAMWDENQVETARRAIFGRLRSSGFPDIEKDIAVSEVWTPTRIAQRYHTPGGAIYGTHSHGWRSAFLRPPNKDRYYQGLYYVGGSTHPGGGTPTVVMSSKITCNLIKRHE
jgi:phytoene desaturase